MTTSFVPAKRTAREIVSGFVYRLPVVGMAFRRFVELHLTDASVRKAEYWNTTLATWGAPYLGGTLSINLRNTITVHLMKELAPAAVSVLDLGCAGGTLGLALGPEITTYCGSDISDVAIASARENLKARSGVTLAVSNVQDFEPSQRYDVILFNEVLYFLTLDELVIAIRRYARFLNENGVILVSLKEHDTSIPIQAILMRELRYAYSVVYQQHPQAPRWKTVRNKETPAYLIHAFRK